MKKIITILVICLLATISNGQTPPYYLTQNGDTVGVVLSIDQVQKLDNDVELLNLFKNLSSNCDSLDSHYITIINTMNQEVGVLEIKSTDLQNENNNKDSLIVNLKSQITNYQTSINLSNQEIQNDKLIISDLNKDLRRQKAKKILGFIGTGTVSAILILVLVHGL